MAVLSWFAGGWARRHPGIAPMLLGAVLLAITFVAAASPSGPGMVVLVIGVVCSVCLGWLGVKLERGRPRRSSAEAILTTLAAPTPSARAVRPEEVIGLWQFYVDAATSTVTVDLQPDGRYTQLIVGNRGQPVGCPGGTWTLEGAHVELDAYRSAARAVFERVRWFFGNWQKDLVLFANDGPQAETMLLGRKITAGSVG
jgi:hypothetical protein